MHGRPHVDELLAEGTLVGRHRILGKLSEGAHAILYMGEHQVTRAEVAIKVLRAAYAASGEMMARFDREARVMGRLAGSPAIVQVHDAGELEDGRRYLVMEFVRGRELSTVLTNCIRRGVPLELERVISIARDLASALRDAHGKGVIHRDLKPSNVMVIREPDGREHAKLVDFGVSGDLEVRGTSADLTATGSVIGTPEYMSPEQAVGLPASVSMDIFALGAVLFEMTTGSLPPQQALRQGAAPRVSTLRPGVPGALDGLVHGCLLVDPVGRVGDAIEVLSRLGTAAEDLAGKADANAWSQGRPVRAAGTLDVVPSGPVAAAVTVVAGSAVAGSVAAGSVAAGSVAAGSVAAGSVAAGSVTAGSVAAGSVAAPYGAAASPYGAAAAPYGAVAAPYGAAAVRPPTPRRPPAGAGRGGAVVALVVLVGVVLGLGAWQRLRNREVEPEVESKIRAAGDTDAVASPPMDAPAAAPEPAPPGPPTPEPGPALPEPALPEPGAPEPVSPEPVSPSPPAAPSGPVLKPIPKPAPKPAPAKPAATTPKPAADPPAADSKSPECVAARAAAQTASDSLDWQPVLQHTRKASCWPDRALRLRLRIEALSELSRYESCLAEGEGSSDPVVIRTVALCRKRLAGAP